MNKLNTGSEILIAEVKKIPAIDIEIKLIAKPCRKKTPSSSIPPQIS